jgi:predicted  nucleic acid-binding Zn-ribbon protein
MSDVQLYLAIGIPMIAVLASLTVSLVQISAIREGLRELRSDVRGDISTIRDDVHSQISAIREDVRSQVSTIHDEVREMRSDMREIRADIKLLTGKVYELMSEKR